MKTRKKSSEQSRGTSAIGLYELPRGWALLKVGEAGAVQLGRQRAPKHHQGLHMRPYLRVANVFEDRIDTSDVLEMNFTPDEFETYRLEIGDILLNEGQSLEWVGRPAIYKGEVPGACFQNTLVRFRAGPAVLPAYALVVFRYFLRAGVFQRIAKWTVNIAHLGAGRFADLDFPVPPLNEQRLIVEAVEENLTRLDAGVANLERVRAKLKRCRAAVLKAACEGSLVPTEAEVARADGRSYEPADRLLARILQARRERWEAEQLAAFEAQGKRPANDKWKERYQEPAGPDTTSLPVLPQGWVWSSFEGLLREPLRNGHSAKASNSPDGVRTLTLTAVTKGEFTLENTKLTIARPHAVENLWIVPGDIFIERSNTPELVGMARLYNGPPDFAIFPDLLIRARIASGVCERFAETVLLAEPSRVYMRKKAQGIAGSMPKIDQSTIERLPFPLPPTAEQQRIVVEVERRLSLIDELEATVAANLKRAHRLRHSILKRAFEGKLVPQDPNDEPAHGCQLTQSRLF
jgi:type I restriction enzyme S subunit